MSLDIDANAFKKRVGQLRSALSDPKLKGSEAWVSVLGKGDEETQRQLATTLHLWLLGVPFANGVVIVGKTKTIIIVAAKQAKHLQSLASDSVSIVTRGKEPEECQKLIGEVLEKQLELSSDAPLAVFEHDKPTSPIASAFLSSVEAREGPKVDGAAIFASLLEIKDESELRAVRMASKAGSGIISHMFVDLMSEILDEGKLVSNEQIAKQVAQSIDNLKLLQKLKISTEFNPSDLDWAIQPTVNENEAGNLGSSGVIRIALTPVYRSYAAQIVRTYLVNASPDQISNYQVLVGAQQRAIQAAVDGGKAEDVAEAAKSYIENKNKDLLQYLQFPVGSGVGLQVFDSALSLKQGNSHKLADDQTLTVALEFKDVPLVVKKEEGAESKGGSKYTLKIADTLRVLASEPIVFTDSAKASSEVAFELEDPEASKKSTKPVKPEVSTADARKMRAARNMEKKEQAESIEREIEEHQAELKQRLQEKGVQRYADTEDAAIGDSGPVFHKFESYKREAQLPKLKNLKIHVDTKSQSIIIPINGRPVPFHVNTFRSGNTSDEGQYVHLRLNFNSPDNNMAKKEDVPYDNPNAQFLKSITLRSKDGERMREILKLIQDLKKENLRRENERKQLADVVQQDKLIESRDKRPPRLDNVFIRPIPEGKRIPGSLEIHRNGVRYTSAIREQTVELSFSNVQHLFFNPNDHEVITLIHFHLKRPIMIGKRKTQDVQFYRDATDMVADDTGHRKRRYRYGDEDELEQEQEERRLRKRLNNEFFQFAEDISRASDGQLDVDSPFRELGFNGVPFRANMFMQPTTNCLVQLTETPFFVVTISEIELAVLERVRFGLKQFDIVLIYKDYKKPVTQINSVPMTQLDSVKRWLNEVDLPFFEVGFNLNWKEVMNTIMSSPNQFFVQDGGWSFLEPEEAASGEEEEESEPGEEEFSVSDEEPEDESEEFSEEGSASDDFEESEAASESEAGEDWSDLEEEAKREDRRKDKKEDL